MKNQVNIKYFWWKIYNPGQIDSIGNTGTTYQKLGLSDKTETVKILENMTQLENENGINVDEEIIMNSWLAN